jgi:hypothetical protein
MKLLRALPFFSLLISAACTSGNVSTTKDETTSDPNAAPFGSRDMTEDEIKRAAGTFGFATTAPAGSYTNSKCVGCHSEMATAEGLDSLLEESYRVQECLNLDSKTPETRRDVLACIVKLRPVSNNDADEPVASTTTFTADEIKAALNLPDFKADDLGIYSAAINHAEFASIFRDAGLEEAYEPFRKKVRMPRGSIRPTDDEIENLVRWFVTGLPGKERYVKHLAPDVCKSPADTFIGSKVKEHVTRMSVEGEGWEYINLARGVPMFACEGTDKANCFQQKNGADDIFPVQADWLNTGVSGTVRKLHTYSKSTDYWIRSSADGRFVGSGGFYNNSAIVDLQPKLTGNSARAIAVEAEYDPSFSSDNQAFLFQGDHGTRICSQSILDNRDLATIDFLNVGCSTTSLEVGLYQGIGSSLDNGDIITINGDFKGDRGIETYQDIAPLFDAERTMTVSRIRAVESTVYGKIDSFTVVTPFQANWMSSPTGMLTLGVVSAATNEQARHGGYRLVLTDAIKKGSPFPAYNDPSTALICTGSGEKAAFSFDERLMVYYAYAKHESTVSPTESSADLFIIDLLGSGMPVQITKMPKGFYAQFPHFRSDGWLYFSVYDAHTAQRHVMATDAGILMTR